MRRFGSTRPMVLERRSMVAVFVLLTTSHVFPASSNMHRVATSRHLSSVQVVTNNSGVKVRWNQERDIEGVVMFASDANVGTNVQSLIIRDAWGRQEEQNEAEKAILKSVCCFTTSNEISLAESVVPVCIGLIPIFRSGNQYVLGSNTVLNSIGKHGVTGTNGVWNIREAETVRLVDLVRRPGGYTNRIVFINGHSKVQGQEFVRVLPQNPFDGANELSRMCGELSDNTETIRFQLSSFHGTKTAVWKRYIGEVRESAKTNCYFFAPIWEVGK